MKKIILSLTMLMVACCALAQDADYLIKQYRKIKGADYENITREIKREAKGKQYIDPKRFAQAERIDKVEFVQVSLSEQEREALTENIKNIKGYQNLYEKKNNVENMLDEGWSLFTHFQYYGIEENGVFKDVIVCIDTYVKNNPTTVIIHAKGKMKAEDIMNMVITEEKKDINLRLDTTY